MCRLTHVILSVSIKDHTVVGPFDKIERMPINSRRPRSVRVRTLDGSKAVRGARHEPKGRPGLNVLAASCP